MPKRVYSAEEREHRVKYQRAYRAQKSASAEWRAKESERKKVNKENNALGMFCILSRFKCFIC
jgi:hypothetical protein